MDVRPGGSWRATMFAGPWTRARSGGRASFARSSSPSGWCSRSRISPRDDAYELVTVRPHRPRRRPHGDALRAARRHDARAVRGRRAGLGDLLRPHGRAPGTLSDALQRASLPRLPRAGEHSRIPRRGGVHPGHPGPDTALVTKNALIYGRSAAWPRRSGSPPGSWSGRSPRRSASLRCCMRRRRRTRPSS